MNSVKLPGGHLIKSVNSYCNSNYNEHNQISQSNLMIQHIITCMSNYRRLIVSHPL